MIITRRYGTVFLTTVLSILQASLILLANEQSSRESMKTVNMISNPGFEMLNTGGDYWRIDKAGKTVAEYVIEMNDAPEGEHSARVTIGQVDDWGTQFGQCVTAGTKGKTYTFAVMVKSIKGPLNVDLQIERRGKTYDRAAKSQIFNLTKDTWKELYVTFKVETDFPEGWFAYISCSQPNCEYLTDIFRLYEGTYIPYEELEKKESAKTALHVFDTGTSSTSPLSREAVTEKKGWVEVKGVDSFAKIRGDTCIANNYMSLIIRKGSEGPEWYYPLGTQMVKGPSLVAVGLNGDRAKSVVSSEIIESKQDRILLEITSTTLSGRKIISRYLLRKNRPLVESQPMEGVEAIEVMMDSKHAVLPDIFGSDLVVDARDCQSSHIRFPSEKMVVQLTDSGNAIVMCAWRSSEQKVNMTLSGEGENRIIDSTRVGCNKDKGFNVWVSVLATPNIWYRQDIKELNPVKDKKLDWQIPFQAVWRADFRRDDGLIDSWPMIIKKPNGEYDSFGIGLSHKRTIWASSRGTYAWPACIEDTSVFLRISRFEGLPELKYKSDGSVLIYPFQKKDDSPVTTFGVIDILRMALSNIPESKLVEEMRVKRVPRDKYPATCAVTAEYEKIFDAKEEKNKKNELLTRLEAMDNFVLGIRSRIDEYSSWAKEIREFCAQEKVSKPQLAGTIAETEKIVEKFDEVWKRLNLKDNNPVAAKVLINNVIALIDSNESDKDEKAKQLGRATRTIGGNQDHSIGDFRVITKEIRQRSGDRMIEAKDDSSFDFNREMRDRTMKMLNCGFGHEGPSTN
jgi:hypothetical protein